MKLKNIMHKNHLQQGGTFTDNMRLIKSGAIFEFTQNLFLRFLLKPSITVVENNLQHKILSQAPAPEFTPCKDIHWLCQTAFLYLFLCICVYFSNCDIRLLPSAVDRTSICRMVDDELFFVIFVIKANLAVMPLAVNNIFVLSS